MAKISSIKSVAARDKADNAYDKAKGIKQGSKADVKLDKKNKVYNFEYGKTKKGGSAGEY
jgi:hypothetical protein